MTAVLAELATVGIQAELVRRGKHLKLCWATAAGLRFAFIPVSSSDWRAARNARAHVRRVLRADGLAS